jgi:galactose mutarotase-like enzyme
MATLHTTQDRFLTYHLTTGSATASIVPERGGILLQWRVGDSEIFYLDQDRYNDPDPTLTIRGGNPILFPLCGNLPNNSFTHNGKPYSLKQHGFARELPWQVRSQTEGGPNDHRPSLTIGLTSSEATLAVYPFPFDFEITYSLDAHSILTTHRITNTGSERLPYSLGFHPYFNASDKSALSFEIPSDTYEDQKTKLPQSFSGQFDWELDEIDVIFSTLKGTTATVSDRTAKTHLTLEASPDFEYQVFWTVKGKPFYCLEPWSGPRNAMNTGKSLIWVEPGATIESTFNLSVTTA